MRCSSNIMGRLWLNLTVSKFYDGLIGFCYCTDDLHTHARLNHVETYNELHIWLLTPAQSCGRDLNGKVGDLAHHLRPGSVDKERTQSFLVCNAVYFRKAPLIIWMKNVGRKVTNVIKQSFILQHFVIMNCISLVKINFINILINRD